MDEVGRLLEDGCEILTRVFGVSDIDGMTSQLAELATDEAVRVREGAVYASRNVLELCPGLVEAWRTDILVELLGNVLGDGVGLVRGLYFDKPPQQTWALPWHKDLTVAVREPIEVTGYSKPRLRAGVWHCEPPVEVLAAILTLRIHLDDVTSENGPLEVLPGSHRTGKSLKIDDFQPRAVLVNAGDVFAMRPLLAHCSGRSKAGTQRHRRVLHLEFAGMRELPGGHEWHTFHQVF